MNKCGKCDNWMKKISCPRENSGHKVVCTETICKEFVLVKWAKELTK